MEVNQNLLKLINLLNSDPEKAKEFSSKKDKKELYEYCVSLVPGYSEEEFTEFMKNLSEYSKKAGNASEISEKDLENISGGTDIFSTIVLAMRAFQEGKQQGVEILNTVKSINFDNT